MARFAISLLAILLLASYASATTLEEVCKGTVDANYCVKLLKPTVLPDTDFNSIAWHKVVLSRGITRALIAKDFMAKLTNVPKSDASALKSCTRKLNKSVKLLREAAAEYGTTNVSAKLDQASAYQEACSDSLEDGGEAMAQVKTQANEAATAVYVVKDLIY